MIGSILTNHEIPMSIIALVIINMMNLCSIWQSPAKHSFGNIDMLKHWTAIFDKQPISIIK